MRSYTMKNWKLDGRKIYRIILIIGLFTFITTFIYYTVESENNITNRMDQLVSTVVKPPETQEDIIVEYRDELILIKDSQEVHEGDLILVNNQVPYHFPSKTRVSSVFYNKGEGYKVRDKDILLSKNTTNALNHMLNDFSTLYKNDDVTVVSGYRTYEYQIEVFKSKVSLVGEKKASIWAAAPGGSEHHTGLAFDLSIYTDNGENIVYDGTGDYSWINENCYQYGLILRYPEGKTDITRIQYEPWHFRYVGLPHAYFMTQNGMALEEYIEFLKGFKFDGVHVEVMVGDDVYEIYYQPATKEKTAIPIPKNCKGYEISGNNIDGFIVTLKYSK